MEFLIVPPNLGCKAANTTIIIAIDTMKIIDVRKRLNPILEHFTFFRFFQQLNVFHNLDL